MTRYTPRLLLVACLGLFAATPSPAADEVSIGNYRTWVIAAAFSPDGSTLATAGGQTLLYRPGEVRLWDPASGKLKASLDGHESAVWCVAFSPDGKTLASGGYDGQVKLWDVAGGKEKLSFEPHKHWVHALAFSPDGKLLATGSEDATIKLWDVTTSPPQDKQTLKGHAAGVTSLVFADNSRLVSGSVDKTAIAWSIPDGQVKVKLDGHTDAVLGVAMVGDAKTVATAGADRYIKIWTLDEAKYTAYAAAQAEAAKKAEEAKKAAEAAAKAAEEAAKKEAAKKEAEKKEEKKEPEKKPEEPKVEAKEPPKAPPSPLELASIEAHKNWISGFAVSRDGKQLYSASHDRTVKGWDVATRKEAFTLSGFTSSVWTVATTPDGKTLAAGSHGDSLKVFNLPDNTERFPAKKP